MLSKFCAAIALLLLGSCHLFQVAQPREAWVTADRLTFAAIATEFETYVRADVSLDDFQVANRLALLEDWRLRIETAAIVLEINTKPSQTASILDLERSE